MASVAAAWSRVTGRGGNSKSIMADLKKITHSEVLDVPKDLFAPVVEASHREEDRQEIMKHLRECLAEPSGKHWRRIMGGLLLVETLMKNASPVLLAETAEGRHFDLVQRLSFLEVYDNTDKRVANTVRHKAEALRKEVVPLLQSASLKDTEDAMRDTASTCSPGAGSTMTRSTTISSCKGFGSDDLFAEGSTIEPEVAKGVMILNNIVTVGHNDDTTDESDGNEDKKRAPVQFREQKRQTARERNERNGLRSDSTDSESDNAEPSKPVVQAVTQNVDLLDL